eukprot:gb/GECH01008547.1/.p1 GENE.gb/GECH01008547.1/~~gb/GECH01008547.1/.p1  ORF type:complete len:274 (+),score=96.72 gb/GECH01008547.1/:1-822(+)
MEPSESLSKEVSSFLSRVDQARAKEREEQDKQKKSSKQQKKRKYKRKYKKDYVAVNKLHGTMGLLKEEEQMWGKNKSKNQKQKNDKQAKIDEISSKGQKGYVRIVTNYGNLNFEIHCDKTPKAAENFLSHCENGYYKGTEFHRLIKGFMIQGGDPTATGQGGDSIWDAPFRDEFSGGLFHDRIGVLSMANRGEPDTNRSQFFITLAPCPHLDHHHTIFGQLVGGMHTLDAVERVPTRDDDDRPEQEVRIEDTVVYVNPFNKRKMPKIKKKNNQ